MPDRRGLIADAGVRLIAAHGLRALTHRAIDAAIDAPPGTTSYYARTRRELLELIVRRLAERTGDDVATAPTSGELDPPRTAALLADLVTGMVRSRPDDHAARFALLTELRGDPELRALLSDRSPIRHRLLAAANALLVRLGVDDAAAHAPNLVVVLDGIVFDHVVGGGRSDPITMIEAYLLGLPRAA